MTPLDGGTVQIHLIHHPNWCQISQRSEKENKLSATITQYTYSFTLIRTDKRNVLITKYTNLLITNLPLKLGGGQQSNHWPHWWQTCHLSLISWCQSYVQHPLWKIYYWVVLHLLFFGWSAYTITIILKISYLIHIYYIPYTVDEYILKKTIK